MSYLPKALGVMALLALAACGVDGAPVKPVANAGVSIGLNGLSTHATVGARKGPLSLGLDLL